AVAVALSAQRTVVVAAGIATDARRGVGAVAARALDPFGAGVLAPGAEGELAAGVAVVQVELADEGLALGVALGDDHAEFALAAPALVVLRADRRDQVRPGLRGAGERHRGEEGRGEQDEADRWHGGEVGADVAPLSHRRPPAARHDVPDCAVCALAAQSLSWRSGAFASWVRRCRSNATTSLHFSGDSPWRSPTRASPASTTRSPTMPATSSTSRPRASR